MTAWAIQVKDRMGLQVGGLVLLDHGHRQLTCDWTAGCGNVAIVAIMPATRESEPQLACAGHLSRMHDSIWARSNPPQLRTYDAAAILHRNTKVAKAS